MPRVSIALVILASLLALAACGGKRSSSSPAAPAEPVAEAPEAGGESGIPGLSVAEVEAQPEAPELPSRFGVGTSREEVVTEAERIAEREARRGTLGELGAETRAVYLTHVWWQGVREIQRSQASHIPGLTVGQLEDQPAAPPLPELFDLTSDSQDLRHHAFILACEEAETDVIGENLIDSRTRYLVWAWEPLLAERQARARAALDQRRARQDYQVADARQQAQWRRDIEAHRRETKRLIEIERHQTIPVLDAQERAELEAITAE